MNHLEIMHDDGIFDSAVDITIKQLDEIIHQQNQIREKLVNLHSEYMSSKTWPQKYYITDREIANAKRCIDRGDENIPASILIEIINRAEISAANYDEEEDEDDEDEADDEDDDDED